ncbi:MAG: divergent polysaccharide deacetylase family protein, partial [Rhodospirillaceae bacterium]|nr:divergent polysaccharide deacetylase family protein [Rhodospirillaceae bacterium]
MTQPAKHRPKAGILGVHPLLATVAAFALVFAGVMFGAWLNVSSRTVVGAPARPVPVTPPKPSRTVPRPAIANMDQVDEEPAPVYGPAIPENYTARSAAPPPPVALRTDPMLAFAVPTAAPKNIPVIAVVIDDMGLDRTRGQQALELPGPLTLSFLTYAGNLSTWVAKAR